MDKQNTSMEPTTSNFREPEWHTVLNCPSCGCSEKTVVNYDYDGERLVKCNDCSTTYFDLVK